MSKINKEFDSITPPGHLEQRVKDAVNDAVYNESFGNLKQFSENKRKNRRLGWRKAVAIAAALVVFVSAVLAGVLTNLNGNGGQPWQVLQRPWQTLEKLSSNPELKPFADLEEIKAYVREFNLNAEAYWEYNEGKESLNTIQNLIKEKASFGKNEESDVVQTDGNFIYTVCYDCLIVMQTEDLTEDLSVKAFIKFDKFFPSSMFLLKDENLLVVLGSEYDYEAGYYKNGAYAAGEDAEKYSQNYWYSNTAVARIYDTGTLADGEDVLLRELKFKNAYVNTASMSESVLYMSLSAYNSFQDGNVWIPEFYDSINGVWQKLSPERIFAAPDNGLFINYALLTGVDVKKSEPAAINGYLGSIDTVYSSEEGFYTAFSAFSEVIRRGKDGREYYDCEYSGTGVVRFETEGINFKYKGYNIARGIIINQFSMDEFKYPSGETYFRIATVLQNGADSWITVFDDSMKATGQLNGLTVKNENIYSVGFYGEKAVAATYKPDEPLYIIDLSSAASPKIQSVVKTTGTADYLYFLDIKDGYVFTAGRRQQKDANWLNGLKVSLFDTSVATARETATFDIGKNYGYSDAAYGHKETMRFVSSEYEMFAFAANLGNEVYENDRYYWVPDYNLFCYTVDKEGNLTENVLRYETVPVSYSNQAEYNSYNSYYADKLRTSIVIGEYVYLIGYHTVQKYNLTNFDGWQCKDIWDNDKIVL